MSDGIAALAAALAKVQAGLPKLERDRTVEVEKKTGGTYSYSYVTLANLSDAILPLLAKHGLSFAAMPGAGADGKMCVRYHLMHESGESLIGEFPISGEGGIQMIGGRITYARRYCLAALVGVAADEDDESQLAEDGARRPTQRAQQPARTRRQPADGEAEGRPTQRAQRAARAPAGAPPLPGEEGHSHPNAETATERFSAEAGAGGKVGQDQHRHMHALWRELGYGGDENRDQRLTIMAKMLGLDALDSSADLTRAQGDTVIAKLRERKGAMGGEGQ
jgi:hypothetical protein